MVVFVAHFLPGSFFVLLGVWWTVNVLQRFFASMGAKRRPFRSRPWYPGPFGDEFPIESTFKLAFGVISIVSTAFYYFRSDSFHESVRHKTHLTMYVFIVLNSAMDLLVYMGLPLPDDLDAASGVLAVGMQAFLLSSHVHDGRPMLEVHVHQLLTYTYYALVLSLCLEIRYQHSVVVSLTKAFFMLLLGTWLCQLAFIVYPPFAGMPRWDVMDPDQAILATLVFTWCMAAIFVAMLCFGAAVWFCMKRDHRLDEVSTVRYQLITAESGEMSVNGKQVNMLSD